MANGDPSLSEAIVAAVAKREGIEVTELSKPLYDVIDPEALDELFRDTRGKVAFTYLGYVVTVDDRANVNLEPITDDETGSVP